MPGVLLDHAITACLAHARLHRVRDVAEPAAGLRLRQSPPQRGLAHLQQACVLRGDIADADGDRRVPVPPGHDRAAVDGDDVAISQAPLLARDAVDDLLGMPWTISSFTDVQIVAG